MALGTIIRSFASPAAAPNGIAWDGSTIWLTDRVAALIYQIDPASGTVIRTFASPEAAPNGLTWDGHALWVATDATNRIWQVDPITGTVIQSIAAPTASPRALAWGGRTLWHTENVGPNIMQLSLLTGAAIRSWVGAGGGLSVALDGAHLWINSIAAGALTMLDMVTQTTIRSIASPTGLIRGMMWDGHTLWLAGDTANALFQVAVN